MGSGAAQDFQAEGAAARGEIFDDEFVIAAHGCFESDLRGLIIDTIAHIGTIVVVPLLAFQQAIDSRREDGQRGVDGAQAIGGQLAENRDDNLISCIDGVAEDELVAFVRAPFVKVAFKEERKTLRCLLDWLILREERATAKEEEHQDD